jgi:hypothetical protein
MALSIKKITLPAKTYVTPFTYDFPTSKTSILY